MRPADLRVHCVNSKCAFTPDRALPILGVDEPIFCPSLASVSHRDG